MASRRFCSQQCARNAQLLAGSNYRKKALRWLDHICERCQQPKELRQIFVHHRDEDRTNNALSNLAVLCTKCHWQLHPNASLMSRRSEASEKAIARGIRHITRGKKLKFGTDGAQRLESVIRAALATFDGEEISL